MNIAHPYYEIEKLNNNIDDSFFINKAREVTDRIPILSDTEERITTLVNNEIELFTTDILTYLRDSVCIFRKFFLRMKDLFVPKYEAIYDYYMRYNNYTPPVISVKRFLEDKVNISPETLRDIMSEIRIEMEDIYSADYSSICNQTISYFNAMVYSILRLNYTKGRPDVLETNQLFGLLNTIMFTDGKYEEKNALDCVRDICTNLDSNVVLANLITDDIFEACIKPIKDYSEYVVRSNIRMENDAPETYATNMKIAFNSVKAINIILYLSLQVRIGVIAFLLVLYNKTESLYYQLNDINKNSRIKK